MARKATGTVEPTSPTRTGDPIERARRAMARKHPGAEVTVRAWRGRPVVVAREGNLIYLARPTNTPRGRR